MNGYSLTPSSGRDYGNECIATLIEQMETYRDSLCVILAGYTNEMEDLLNANTGFASRIQFKLYFPDYSADELYKIFKKMCKDRKYKLDRNIEPILIQYFEEAKKQDNFGNARAARSLLDKITMEQAQRIVLDPKADVNLIKKIDIENTIEQIQKQQPKVEIRKIGFAI